MAYRLLTACVPALLGLLLTGCNSEPPTGVVKGKVTLDGNNLPSGIVTFVGPDGRRATGAINDGAYVADRVPIGKCKVSVSWAPKVGVADSGSRPEIQEAIVIPDHYSESNSEESVVVNKGPTIGIFDLNMTSR